TACCACTATCCGTTCRCSAWSAHSAARWPPCRATPACSRHASISRKNGSSAGQERSDGGASSLSDVVLHRHRLTRQHERAHLRLELLIGERAAGALVQVVGP